MENYAPKKSKRNTTVDFIRGFAIIVVVLGHAIQANILDEQTCFIWSKIIVAFQMPLLFYISGYTAGFSFPSNNSTQFIKKKTLRLFVPYLSWSILHYILVAFLPNDYKQFGLLAFFKEIFISDFWFLRNLFIIFIIMWMCNILLHTFHFKNNKIFSIIILLLCSVLMIVFNKIPLLSTSFSLWYYLWFVLGYISFILFQNEKVSVWLKKRKRRNIIAVISLFVLIIMVVVLSKRDIPSKIVAIIFTLGLLAILTAMEKYFPYEVKVFVEELGKKTLPIYGIHWCLLFSPLWRIGFYIKYLSFLPLAVSIFITFLIWIIICVLLIKIFEKSKVIKLLFLGEK